MPAVLCATVRCLGMKKEVTRRSQDIQALTTSVEQAKPDQLAGAGTCPAFVWLQTVSDWLREPCLEEVVVVAAVAVVAVAVAVA